MNENIKSKIDEAILKNITKEDFYKFIKEIIGNDLFSESNSNMIYDIYHLLKIKNINSLIFNKNENTIFLSTVHFDVLYHTDKVYFNDFEIKSLKGLLDTYYNELSKERDVIIDKLGKILSCKDKLIESEQIITDRPPEYEDAVKILGTDKLVYADTTKRAIYNDIRYKWTLHYVDTIKRLYERGNKVPWKKEIKSAELP